MATTPAGETNASVAEPIRMGALKLVAAILLGIAAYCSVNHVAREFTSVAAPAAPTGRPSGGSQIPGTVPDFEKALAGMKETNDLLINWAIVLLGGTIGIAIMAKGAKIQDRNWGLIFIPPTWILLAASLNHATQFKGSLTFQLAEGKYSFRDLNMQLFLQMEFFKYSIWAVVALAAWYLFFRLLLWEERTEGD